MTNQTYYKLTRPDGWDFYTGKTINYRQAVGGRVLHPTPNPSLGICSQGVLHASLNPLDCFQGARIPCAAFKVAGVPILFSDPTKHGFTELEVLEEIIDLNTLFGFNYSEAINPINPFKLPKRKPTQNDIALLRECNSIWASIWDSIEGSVGNSVGNSVLESVWDSVRASVGASVGASVWASVWDSVGASIWASVGDSIWDSVRASVGAYIGSLFPGIQTWEYTKSELGVYPFQTLVDLWKRGLVPSYDGQVWRLHSGRKAGIVWEGRVR